MFRIPTFWASWIRTSPTSSLYCCTPWGCPLWYSLWFFCLLYRSFLKGQCHEIFCFWFFSWISFPKPLIIPLGPFQIFKKIRGDICSSRLPPVSFWHRWHTGVNDTGGKFATGVVDTGGKIATCVVDAVILWILLIFWRLLRDDDSRHESSLSLSLAITDGEDHLVTGLAIKKPKKPPKKNPLKMFFCVF